MRLIDLAERIGASCECSGRDAKELEVSGVASFGSASTLDVVFVEHARFLELALGCGAAAVIVPADVEILDTNGKALLRSRNPRLAFALAAGELRRQQACGGRVDASAVVDPTARLHPTACVDELCVVGAGASIGARSRLGPGCMIGPGAVIGEDCELVARVCVSTGTTLGNRVIVQPGAVLGGDGFGFVPDPATGRYHKFPQIGRLEIGNDVEVGANTTIDRGALDATVISDGVKLDNLVQIGHNVHIGRNVVVASQTGISGSSVLEDGVIVGGQVGIADHVRIESGAILGAQCGVPSKKVIRGRNVVFWGTPARPIAEYLRELATLARLTRNKK
jgi:UDP-3-O-[3-hydroxymyristoyl] glucosamine N-acyltransferase